MRKKFNKNKQQQPQCHNDNIDIGPNWMLISANCVRLYGLIFCLRPGLVGFPPFSQAINIWVNPFIWSVWRGDLGIAAPQLD